jgi:hypothetical protein
MSDQVRSLSAAEIDAVAGGIILTDVVISSAYVMKDMIISSAVGKDGKSDDAE